MSAPPALPVAGRFNAGRPDDLRAARPWHRLAYIIEALPAGLRPLVAELHVGPGDRVLDFGCAEGPYHAFFQPGVEIVGADLPGNPHATLVLREDGTVPAEDSSFDAVLSTQVLEHVADPQVYLAECARVLRPGGRLLLSTHGMMVWHPDPVDLWRWTCDGLRVAVEREGMRVERFEGIMGLGATGLQFVQDAHYHRFPRRLQAPFALVMQTLVRLADRFERAEHRRYNALVFALVARKR